MARTHRKGGPMNWPTRSVIVVGIAISFAIAAMVFHFGGVEIPTPEDMAIQLKSLGIWGPIAVIGLMIVHSFLPFPAEVLAVCAGAVFGTFLGSALIWVGAMIGAFLAFWISRWIGYGAVRSWVSEKNGHTLDQWMNEQGAITLLVSRFIPLIAFNLINYAAGLTRVSIWTFVWTTGLGILPVTVLSAYLGSHMMTLEWSVLLGLSAVSIVIVLFGHMIAKRRGWI